MRWIRREEVTNARGLWFWFGVTLFAFGLGIVITAKHACAGTTNCTTICDGQGVFCTTTCVDVSGRP